MILYCLGMQSSGSTWLYNVAREILDAAKIQHAAYRAETAEDMYDNLGTDVTNALLRGHNLESGLLRFLKLANVKAIVSYRDPRDAIASFMQRFGDYGARFPRVCNDAFRNLASILSASQYLDQLTFYYEDGFTSDPNSVRRIADFLGYKITEDQVEEIFDKYSAETVRAFMAELDKLDNDRLFVDDKNNAMDRVTSFHRTHISDMRVDKWRDVFNETQQNMISVAFGDVSRLLSEKKTGPGVDPSRNPDTEGLAPVSFRYSSDLFGPVDNISDFSRFLNCAEVSGGLGIKVLEYLFLPDGIWDFTLSTSAVQSFRVKFCQEGRVHRDEATENGVVKFRFRNVLQCQAFDLHISYSGMEKDMEKRMPVPSVLLEARLVEPIHQRT